MRKYYFKQAGYCTRCAAPFAPDAAMYEDANGVTTYHDAAGFVTGKTRSDANGVTTFYDAAGRVRFRASRR